MCSLNKNIHKEVLYVLWQDIGTAVTGLYSTILSLFWLLFLVLHLKKDSSHWQGFASFHHARYIWQFDITLYLNVLLKINIDVDTHTDF